MYTNWPCHWNWTEDWEVYCSPRFLFLTDRSEAVVIHPPDLGCISVHHGGSLSYRSHSCPIWPLFIWPLSSTKCFHLENCHSQDVFFTNHPIRQNHMTVKVTENPILMYDLKMNSSLILCTELLPCAAGVPNKVANECICINRYVCVCIYLYFELKRRIRIFQPNNFTTE